MTAMRAWMIDLRTPESEGREEVDALYGPYEESQARTAAGAIDRWARANAPAGSIVRLLQIAPWETAAGLKGSPYGVGLRHVVIRFAEHQGIVAAYGLFDAEAAEQVEEQAIDRFGGWEQSRMAVSSIELETWDGDAPGLISRIAGKL